MKYLQSYWKPIALHASLCVAFMYFGNGWIMSAYIVGYTVGLINGEWTRSINATRLD